jgi:hypothetical protein
VVDPEEREGGSGGGGGDDGGGGGGSDCGGRSSSGGGCGAGSVGGDLEAAASTTTVGACRVANVAAALLWGVRSDPPGARPPTAFDAFEALTPISQSATRTDGRGTWRRRDSVANPLRPPLRQTTAGLR